MFSNRYATVITSMLLPNITKNVADQKGKKRKARKYFWQLSFYFYKNKYFYKN